jgi:tRNA pseudouridine55 synthase
VIAHEFGEKLGCGAYLKSLRRTKVGDFNVEDAFQINNFVDYARALITKREYESISVAAN